MVERTRSGTRSAAPENDKAVRELARELERLQQAYGISAADITTLVKQHHDRTTVPITIFATELLTPLEAILLYLADARGMRFADIAPLVGRDQRNVATAYHRAKEKAIEASIDISSSNVAAVQHHFPLALLVDRRLSAFEHVVHYLAQRKLTNAEIAQLTKRDQRTIWTLLARAKKKLA